MISAWSNAVADSQTEGFIVYIYTALTSHLTGAFLLNIYNLSVYLIYGIFVETQKLRSPSPRFFERIQQQLDAAHEESIGPQYRELLNTYLHMVEHIAYYLKLTSSYIAH